LDQAVNGRREEELNLRILRVRLEKILEQPAQVAKERRREAPAVERDGLQAGQRPVGAVGLPVPWAGPGCDLEPFERAADRNVGDAADRNVRATEAGLRD
jgi:hypothetical protein